MRQLTDDAQRALGDIAARYGVSTDAAQHLLVAVVNGYTTQAQFNHPELGGMGQWSQGGMIMVGDMFNNALKARVDGLCNELAALARSADVFRPLPPQQSQSQFQGNGNASSLFVPGPFNNWWPGDLGQAASTGSQNNLRYAFFPDTRRLAIDVNGKVTVYDTQDHRIGGFSQQQSGDQSLSFTSQYGLVSLASLHQISVPDASAPPSSFDSALQQAFSAEEPQQWEAAAEFEPTPIPVVPQQASVPAKQEEDILDKIERLAGLHAKGILTDEEFAAKKTELLNRL